MHGANFGMCPMAHEQQGKINSFYSVQSSIHTPWKHEVLSKGIPPFSLFSNPSPRRFIFRDLAIRKLGWTEVGLLALLSIVPTR